MELETFIIVRLRSYQFSYHFCPVFAGLFFSQGSRLTTACRSRARGVGEPAAAASRNFNQFSFLQFAFWGYELYCGNNESLNWKVLRHARQFCVLRISDLWQRGHTKLFFFTCCFTYMAIISQGNRLSYHLQTSFKHFSYIILERTQLRKNRKRNFIP